MVQYLPLISSHTFLLYCITGYFPQVQIFPNGEPLALAEIFPIQKFISPTTEKSYLSDSYKVYMDKTVICHTLVMSTVIIVLYSCMITTFICAGVSKNSRSSAVYLHKESSLVWPDPFLAESVNRLQFKHPAKLFSMVVYTYAHRICHVAIYMC